jgi:manganese transport protein
MQLGFAIWPLMRFTDDKTKMGEFANRSWLRWLGWTTVAVIIVLNLWLIFTTVAPDSVKGPVFQFLGWPVPTS